jgi:hypothetical protein
MRQLYKREPSGVLAVATVGAVEIRVVDVCKARYLELGVFYPPTETPASCGLLLYKSYSVRRERTLYETGCAACRDCT